VQPFWQQVAVGAVLIAAVFIDQRRRAAAARGGKRSSLRFRGAGKGSSEARGGES
jgi:ribose transport system permease protein